MSPRLLVMAWVRLRKRLPPRLPGLPPVTEAEVPASTPPPPVARSSLPFLVRATGRFRSSPRRQPIAGNGLDGGLLPELHHQKCDGDNRREFQRNLDPEWPEQVVPPRQGLGIVAARDFTAHLGEESRWRLHLRERGHADGEGLQLGEDLPAPGARRQMRLDPFSSVRSQLSVHIRR